MEKIIEDILLKGRQVFESLKQPDLSVLTISIYHSTQIILKARVSEAGKAYEITCNYCKSFRGATDVWPGVNLTLDYVKEILKSGERIREEYWFELKDLKNNYFVICKNLLFDEVSDETNIKYSNKTIDIQEIKDNSADKDIDELNKILQECAKSRVRIINSDKHLLNVRLDVNTDERFLNFSKNHPDEWYKLDSENFLDILCYNPVFLNANFQSWEINEALKIYKDQNVFILTDHKFNFEIKCDLIKINK